MQERVVQFGPDRGLVGILTLPDAGAEVDAPHVVLLNSGIIHRVGSSRLHVDLARALSSVGVAAFRFDLSGIGDSKRRSDVESVRESVERDVACGLAIRYDGGSCFRSGHYQAEIDHLHGRAAALAVRLGPRPGQDQVRRLHVTVRQAVAVGPLQALGGLADRFKTSEEAETFAINLAKAWIDADS